MSGNPFKPVLKTPSVPASVRSLRAYWKDRANPETPDHFVSELMGQSDRASVVLMGSQLDDALTFRLSQAMAFHLDGKHFEDAFRYDGPLGSFSARIDMAYLFGVIDNRTRSQLNDFREMRNACAHSKHKIDFSIPQLCEVAKRVFQPTGFFPPPKDSPGIKTILILEFLVIYHTLLSGSREEGERMIMNHLSRISDESTPSPDKSPEP